MSLIKDLQGKQVLGIILVAVLLLVVFGYGYRSYKKTGSNCAMEWKKSCKNETCQVEVPAETEEVVK